MTADLIDHLQDSGYMPDDDPKHIGDWYDLVASGVGAVRVVTYDGEVSIHAFDKFMACEWSVQFRAVPDAVIIGTLQAAEWELAARRGGPVTPAQAQNA